MHSLPLKQDFYSKSHHVSPQNSSQIYAYDGMYDTNVMTKYSNNKYPKLNDYANLSSIYHHTVSSVYTKMNIAQIHTQI